MGLPVRHTDNPDFILPEDYLRLERAAELKYEYYQGEIRAMAGASCARNRICANLTGELHGQLRGKDCSIVGSDQRLQILGGSAHVYSDLTVVCGAPEFNEETLLILC